MEKKTESGFPIVSIGFGISLLAIGAIATFFVDLRFLAIMIIDIALLDAGLRFV